jgi:hypothetical protein
MKSRLVYFLSPDLTVQNYSIKCNAEVNSNVVSVRFHFIG